MAVTYCALNSTHHTKCRSGVLADMAAHGVEAVDCCAVDNVLAPLGDPLFAGHCTAAGAECGARCRAMLHPMRETCSVS